MARGKVSADTWGHGLVFKLIPARDAAAVDPEGDALMPRYEERKPLSAADIVVAVRAAYRLGILDVMLRSKRLQPGIRARVEAERELKLIDLRSAGMTEEAFE